MATLQDVQTHLQTVSDGVDRIAALVQSLKDQLAAGSPVTQADLDALDASVQTISAKETAVS